MSLAGPPTPHCPARTGGRMLLILKLSRHSTSFWAARARDSNSCQEQLPAFHSYHCQERLRVLDVSHQGGWPHPIVFCPSVLLRFMVAFSLMSFSNTLIFDLRFHFWVIIFTTTTGRVTWSTETSKSSSCPRHIQNYRVQTLLVKVWDGFVEFTREGFF